MWPLHVRSHVPLRPSHNRSTPSFAPLRRVISQEASKQDGRVTSATPEKVQAGGHPFHDGHRRIVLAYMSNAERLW